MNINKIMKQAQAMQKKMEEMQAKLGQMEVKGSAGGNMVQATILGTGEAKAVAIDAKLMDASEKEVLEDLIVAAFNDAKRKLEEETKGQMNQMMGGMSLPPGFKMPF